MPEGDDTNKGQAHGEATGQQLVPAAEAQIDDFDFLAGIGEEEGLLSTRAQKDKERKEQKSYKTLGVTYGEKEIKNKDEILKNENKLSEIGIGLIEPPVYKKKGFAIDKGNLRERKSVIDEAKFRLDYGQYITNDSMTPFIKGSKKIAKDIWPGEEKFFMPLLIDMNKLIGEYYPVQIHKEGLNAQQIETLNSRHTIKEGYFDRKKIKLSNINLNTNTELLNNEDLGISSGGIVNRAFGALANNELTRDIIFNDAHGKNIDILGGIGDEDKEAEKEKKLILLIIKNNPYETLFELSERFSGNTSMLGIWLNELQKDKLIKSTRLTKNKIGKKTYHLSDKTSEKINREQRREKDSEANEAIDNEERNDLVSQFAGHEYFQQIERGISMAQNHMRSTLKFTNGIKMGIPFINLTGNGLLIDFRMEVPLMGAKNQLTSSFIVIFGDEITFNYIGSELKDITELNIGEDEYVNIKISTKTLIHDANSEDSLFKSAKPKLIIQSKIGNSKVSAKADLVIYNTNSKAFSITNGRGSFLSNATIFEGINGFSARATNINIVENELKTYDAVGNINGNIPLLNYFSITNPELRIIFNNGEQTISGNSIISFDSTEVKGIGQINGNAIVKFEKSIDSSLKYSINKGLINASFFGDTLTANGVNYSSENPNEISAKSVLWKGTILGYEGALFIVNPTITNDEGFSFKKGLGRIYKLNYGEYLQIDSIWVGINKENEKYKVYGAVDNLAANLKTPIPGLSSVNASGNFTASGYDDGTEKIFTLDNGDLSASFFSHNLDLTGVNYSSLSPNTISATALDWTGEVLGYNATINISNPAIIDKKGFNFSSASGSFDGDINVLNLFTLQSPALSLIHKDDLSYAFKFSSGFKVKPQSVNMFGSNISITSSFGVINYDSEAVKKITLKNGSIEGNVMFGGANLLFSITQLENNENNLLAENLLGSFSYKKYGISNIGVAGNNLSITTNNSSNEIEYDSIKAEGLKIQKKLGFMEGSINSVEIKNNAKDKRILVSVKGALNDFFEKNINTGKNTFDGAATALLGYDFKIPAPLFKLQKIEGNASVSNPVRQLNNLIEPFSNGNKSITAYIPVFPGIDAFFRAFIELVTQLGSEKLQFSATLAKNAIRFEMEENKIGDISINAGVEAGVSLGSPLLVALELALKAYGKIDSIFKLGFDSTINYLNESEKNIITDPKSFHGFHYSLNANIGLKADLVATARAFWVFSKSFEYNVKEKNLGSYSYSSKDRNSKIEEAKNTLVPKDKEEEFKSKGGLKGKYRDMDIQELVGLSPDKRLSKKEKNQIIENFKFQEDRNLQSDSEKPLDDIDFVIHLLNNTENFIKFINSRIDPKNDIKRNPKLNNSTQRSNYKKIVNKNLNIAQSYVNHYSELVTNLKSNEFIREVDISSYEERKENIQEIENIKKKTFRTSHLSSQKNEMKKFDSVLSKFKDQKSKLAKKEESLRKTFEGDTIVL